MRELVANLASARAKYLAKTEEDINRGKLAKIIFDQLVEVDPTPTKKYLEWVCRDVLRSKSYQDWSLAWGRDGIHPKKLTYIEDTLSDLYHFEKSQLLKGFDINRFQGDIEALEKMLEGLKGDKADRRLGLNRLQKGKDYELVKETPGWWVFKILSYKGSRTLGSGTPWCVVANEGHYKNYTKNGLKTFFYVLNKNQAGLKYAVLTQTIREGSDPFKNPMQKHFATEITTPENGQITETTFQKATGLTVELLEREAAGTVDMEQILRTALSADSVKMQEDGKYLVYLKTERPVIIANQDLLNMSLDFTDINKSLRFYGGVDELHLGSFSIRSFDFLKDLKFKTLVISRSLFLGPCFLNATGVEEVRFTDCDFNNFSVEVAGSEDVNLIGWSNSKNFHSMSRDAVLRIWQGVLGYKSPVFPGKVFVQERIQTFGVVDFEMESRGSICAMYLEPNRGSVDLHESEFSDLCFRAYRNSSYGGIVDNMETCRGVLRAGRKPEGGYVLDSLKYGSASDLRIYVPVENFSKIQIPSGGLKVGYGFDPDLGHFQDFRGDLDAEVNWAPNPTSWVFNLPKADPGVKLELNIFMKRWHLFKDGEEIFPVATHVKEFKGRLFLRYHGIEYSRMNQVQLERMVGFLNKLGEAGMDLNKVFLKFLDTHSMVKAPDWIDMAQTDMGGQNIVSNLFRGI